jgi:hypothetical protein
MIVIMTNNITFFTTEILIDYPRPGTSKLLKALTRELHPKIRFSINGITRRIFQDYLFYFIYYEISYSVK